MRFTSILSLLLLVTASSARCVPSTGVASAVPLKRRLHLIGRAAAVRGGSSDEPDVGLPSSPMVPSPMEPFPMTREMADTEEAVSAVWTRHRRWSLAATRQNRRISFYRNLHLSLMVSGAFFQTLAARFHTSHYGWLVALVGGGCLGAAPLISNTYLSKETKSDWIRSRATSEQIKAQVFLFRAGVPPYDVDDPVQTLVNRVADISEGAKDLRVEFVMTKTDGKKPPPALDRPGYLKYRLEPQIQGFYIRTARQQARKSELLKEFQAILAVGSSMIGIVAGSAGGAAASVKAGAGGQAVFSHFARDIGIWGASLATAASSFGSFVESGKYDDQVVERSTAAQRLENLYLRLPNFVGPGSEDWTVFVLQCEEVIASTSKQWANLLAGSSSRGAKKKENQ